jgi:hypothetical protein
MNPLGQIALAAMSLAREIYEEFDAARERYTPRLPFDSLLPMRPEPLRMWMEVEERLPFAARRA